MKLTKEQLRRIIKEEIKEVLKHPEKPSPIDAESMGRQDYCTQAHDSPELVAKMFAQYGPEYPERYLLGWENAQIEGCDDGIRSYHDDDDWGEDY